VRNRSDIFVDGKFETATSSDRIDVFSPHSEQLLGSVPDASRDDVDRAVNAANSAFHERGWSATPLSERAHHLRELAKAIRRRGAEYSTQISEENGIPRSFTFAAEVGGGAAALDAYAGFAESLQMVEERDGASGFRIKVRKVPVGVSAAIVPWNGPLFIASLKIGAALAAGSPLILKVSPEAPLNSYVLAEAAIDADLPAGVLNIIAATTEVSEYLVRHPGVDKVAFTGSAAVGRRVAGTCGSLMKRCTTELGGKSAAVLLPDVKVNDELCQALVTSSLQNNGEVCASQSRILVPAELHDELVEALATHISELRVGNPLDEPTDIGPMVSEQHMGRVLSYIESGKSEGARLVFGGGRVSTAQSGWYLQPTLFSEVVSHMRIAQEEIFGPVIGIMKYETEEDAIRIANESEYGLCGSVWSENVERALEVAASIRTGLVAINSPTLLDLNAPFGGFGQSGIGRESGPEGLDAYLEYQTIITPVVTTS
jgi:aldehyde dehydrogenase (NAD+)